MDKSCIEVCAGVVFFGHKLLLATRRPGGALAGKWEFPGGKCAAGETLAGCIARELREELSATVTAAEEVCTLVHEYPEKTVRLHFMLCRLAGVSGLSAQEGQDFGWFRADELAGLDFAPADRGFVDAVAGGVEEAGLTVVSRALADDLGSWLRGEREQGLQVRSRKPEWLRVPFRGGAERLEMRRLLSHGCLHTVCESAQCPNVSECWRRKTATFMVLGDVCTRNCRFCAVGHGRPLAADEDEPRRVAESVRALGLRHVVVTMVTRDDLPDGGAGHVAKVVAAVCELSPTTSVEVLVSDFRGQLSSVETVLGSGLRVFGHNLETVERLTPRIRTVASYAGSLAVLRHASARRRADCLVKSGLMLGLGESEEEIAGALRDLRDCGVDIVTLGQYLQPTLEHWPVARQVSPEEFASWRRFAEEELGFRRAVCGPLVRSSYLAEEALQER